MNIDDVFPGNSPEVDRLNREIKRLRAALWRIAHNVCMSEKAAETMVDIAREALSVKVLRNEKD